MPYCFVSYKDDDEWRVEKRVSRLCGIHSLTNSDLEHNHSSSIKTTAQSLFPLLGGRTDWASINENQPTNNQDSTILSRLYAWYPKEKERNVKTRHQPQNHTPNNNSNKTHKQTAKMCQQTDYKYACGHTSFKGVKACGKQTCLGPSGKHSEDKKPGNCYDCKTRSSSKNVNDKRGGGQYAK